MPIYEYQCKKCDGVFEVMHGINADGPSKCELCGSKRVERIMSLSSFALKGDGWYVTDYANKGKGKDKGSEESGDKKDGKKDGKNESGKSEKKKSEKSNGKSAS